LKLVFSTIIVDSLREKYDYPDIRKHGHSVTRGHVPMRSGWLDSVRWRGQFNRPETSARHEFAQQA
jgi:hypothetical protein